jgi:hypothetical protein
MSAAIPLLSLYSIRAWPRKTFLYISFTLSLMFHLAPSPYSCFYNLCYIVQISAQKITNLISASSSHLYYTITYMYEYLTGTDIQHPNNMSTWTATCRLHSYTWISKDNRGKAVPLHAMKAACKVNRSIGPLILDLGTIWRWATNFRPQPLYPRKQQETGWATQLVWTVMEKRKYLAPARIQTLGPQLVAIRTMLSQILSIQTVPSILSKWPKYNTEVTLEPAMDY